MTIEDKNVVENLQSEIETVLCPHGFEVRPFLTGWYNQLVSTKFHLDYPEDTLAFVIISQPSMFEKAFLPFLASHYKSGTSSPELRDPIDECMLHYFSLLAPRLDPAPVTLHDFQLSPARRPKILVQTAGHVSGAATFYQPKVSENKSENVSGKISFRTIQSWQTRNTTPCVTTQSGAAGSL